MPSVSSLEEAAAVLGAANASSRRVRIGEGLTTGRLTRILEHDPGDQTCTVEAGVRLSELRATLAAAGQRLSLDPPGDPTIGALLARNLSGPLRHRFGAPRDLVLGATLVLGDGTIASSGGKVVKNVAGYDLARLVCGSEGRLAFIARASFRLHPLPRSAQTILVEHEDAAAVVETLLASQLQPSALDVLHPGRVAMLFEGSERAVEAQVATTIALVGGVETSDEVWIEAHERQGAARHQVRFAPGELAATLSTFDDAIVRPSAGIAYVHASPCDNLSHGLESSGPARDGESDKLSQGSGAQALVARIARALDPGGVLSG